MLFIGCLCSAVYWLISHKLFYGKSDQPTWLFVLPGCLLLLCLWNICTIKRMISKKINLFIWLLLLAAFYVFNQHLLSATLTVEVFHNILSCCFMFCFCLRVKSRSARSAGPIALDVLTNIWTQVLYSTTGSVYGHILKAIIHDIIAYVIYKVICVCSGLVKSQQCSMKTICIWNKFWTFTRALHATQ